MLTIPYFNKRPGFCRSGARQWFERHGLDFTDFMRNGLPAEVLEATGDGMALAIVKWARECESKEAIGG